MTKAQTRMDLAKLDASIARFKARTLELKAKRHTLVRIDEPPKPHESAHSEKKARALPPAGSRCHAKTMEGKQCGFKATCGKFCKKHAIKT
jgi:hypothetical protein